VFLAFDYFPSSIIKSHLLFRDLFAMSSGCCSSGTTRQEYEVVVSSLSSKEILAMGVKVILVGDTNTGKSSLVDRCVKDIFLEERESTIGAAFMVKSIVVDDVTVKLQIWDTAGQERFSSLFGAFFRGAYVAIIVYDITSKESFESVRKWTNEIDKHCTEPNMVIALVGNKMDRYEERQVSAQEADNMLEEIRKRKGETAYDTFVSMECSAKTGRNCDKLFVEICKKLVTLPLEKKSYVSHKVAVPVVMG